MSVLEIIYLVVAILLIVVILLQQRGAGLGEAFGGSSSSFSSRRGAEKSLYQITIFLAIAFIGIALFTLYQRSQPQLPASVLPTAETEVTTETEATGEEATSGETTDQPADTEPVNEGATTNQ